MDKQSAVSMRQAGQSHKLFGRFATLSPKTAVSVVVVSLIALALYAAGVKFLLLPVLIVLNAWLLPLPRIFTSWLGRLVMATLITMGVIQIVASLQLIFGPGSGFVALAIWTWLLHVAVWLWAPRPPRQRLRLISTSDICACVVVLGFLLPFTDILLGHSGILRIAQIGSLQAIDATNHYGTIAELTHAQHLHYAKGYYLPKGFQLAVSFMQNSFFHSQYEFGWSGNALLYFGDYLLYGSILGYLLFYLCLSWLKSLKDKLVPDGWAWSKLLVAACLAAPMTLLYLLPFVSEGFLSYYYVCITFVAGALLLGELKAAMASRDSSLDMAHDAQGRWALFAYLLVIFGAAATWPLLIPPFVLCGALFLLPDRLQLKLFMKRLLAPQGWPVLLAFAIQLLPIYFQLKYSSTSTEQSLNLTGGLTQFHPFVLLVGLLIVLAVMLKADISEAYRRFVANVFLPLFAFTGVFVVFQYFTTGNVLYYAIKTSLLLEMLLLALAVALLVRAFVDSPLYGLRSAWLLPFVPLTAMVLLISVVSNPLKDVRDVFRDRSYDVIPQYLPQDVSTDVRLGTAGKIRHFNLMVLHYNPAQGKYFADMQVPYWANMMQYDASRPDFLAAQCIGQLYSNLAFGDYSAAEQQAMIKELKLCATNVRKRGETFYVVTDPASAPHVRGIIGNLATIVLDS